MPRVYLIFRNQMFSDAIQTILDKQPEIERVAVTNEPDRMAVDVVALNPDVILLEETENGLSKTTTPQYV